MTGPEHYHEAERLLDQVSATDGDPATFVNLDQLALITRALAHATLANTVATAHVAMATDSPHSLHLGRREAWREVAA